MLQDHDKLFRVPSIPRGNVAHVRILRHSFGMKHIRAEIDRPRAMVKADGAPDKCIGECERD
jgi:hypothetical protein